MFDASPFAQNRRYATELDFFDAQQHASIPSIQGANLDTRRFSLSYTWLMNTTLISGTPGGFIRYLSPINSLVHKRGTFIDGFEFLA